MTKKLSLSKETLRALDGAEAGEAQGGVPNTWKTCGSLCDTAQKASMCVCVFSLKWTCDSTIWAE